MEFESLNSERNPNQFYRNRTQKVLEKWGVDGELNQMNLRTAASSYARIQLKYRMMKFVVIGAVLFLAIFMGLMIGSVVLGIEATKEFNVKDQTMVQGSKNVPLKTSEVTYTTSLKLTTPLSVVQGIKSLRYETTTKEGNKEYLQFEVVSFYYSNGRNLTLYGHTQMAKVLSDGSVEIIPISTVDGAKRFDSSRTVRSDSATAQTTSQSTTTSVYQSISTCDDFRNIDPNGKYYFANDIDCGSTYYSPLPAFGGILNGRMFTLTMNVNGSSGEAGVFLKVLQGAFIMNINFRGNITGTKVCGGLAARVDSAIILYTVNMYSDVVCRPSTETGGTRIFVGGYFGYLDTYYSPKRLVFYRCLTQGSIRVNTNFPENVFMGGFFGLGSVPDFKVFYRSVTTSCYFADVVEYFNSLLTKRSENRLVPNANLIHADLIGWLPTQSEANLADGNTKRAITVQSDLNSVCDPSYGTAEGMAWYDQWVNAYIDLTDGITSGHENASSTIHEANVAMCINFYYNNLSQSEAVCCRDFGITYNTLRDCYNYYCPNTIINKLSYPCFWCKALKKKKDAVDPNYQPTIVNGVAINDIDQVPEFYYNGLN